jgi:hypothetical protein
LVALKIFSEAPAATSLMTLVMSPVMPLIC